MKGNKMLSGINIKLLIKISIAVMAIYLLFNTGSLDFKSILIVLDFPYLFLFSLLCLFLGIVISGIRWWILLGITENNISIKTVLSIQLMGSFFSSWLPGAAGGDAVKGVLLFKLLDSRRSTALVSIAIDRIFAVFGLFSIALVASAFLSSSIDNVILDFYINILEWGILIGLLVVLFFCICIFMIKSFSLHVYLPVAIRSYFSPLGKIASYYKKSWFQLLLSCILSMLASGIVVVGIVVISLMYEFSASPAVTAIAGVIGNVSSVVPVTPGGIGVGEAVFAKISSDLSGSFAPFATIYFTFRIGMLLANIPGMLITMAYSNTRHRELNNS
ncbi:lysylphosphatidylglycerol synthase transmembrane domain-containing protein [Vibrio sinaloensis]|uniref:lysylphosphatidylglycerol synthase transmembrane domain-containing protein n=1 Tax=Photobacterium sp. (strain ATCC 43367) TaxID=379097 RepID=UPI0022AFC9E7|nr:lysylphosphatidylglycerol synthase transmembrane domain-containing protein [Vibrio sinaloensis]MCZ4294813.1 lysylphosphatidylglycerol synthase transmembrane domain-containing protein [Vibrio sinaloensis]